MNECHLIDKPNVISIILKLIKRLWVNYIMPDAN